MKIINGVLKINGNRFCDICSVDTVFACGMNQPRRGFYVLIVQAEMKYKV